MVRVTVPVVAVGFAVSVSVLVVAVGLGLKAAVTALGSVEGDRVTLPVKPFCGETVIVLAPLLLCVTVRHVGVAVRGVLGGAAAVGLMGVVVGVRVPEAPVMVTVTVPVVAVALAVSVTVLDTVAGLGLKAAVTPVGRPEADSWTLPVKPFSGETEIVLEL